MRSLRLPFEFAAAVMIIALVMGCSGAEQAPAGLWPKIVPTDDRIQIQLPLSIETDGLKGQCLYETVHWKQGGDLPDFAFRGHKECIPPDAGTTQTWHIWKPLKTASRPGFYGVHVTYAATGNEVLRTQEVHVFVVSRSVYCLFMAVFLIAVFFLFYWTQPTKLSGRRTLLLTALILVTLPIWLPVVLDRLQWFIVLAGILGLIARRCRGPDLRMAWSVTYILFLEWYWGVCMYNVSLHGFIISTSAMGVLMLVARLLIRNRSVRSWTFWALTVTFAFLYVSMAVYDSFFQDFPAAATLEFVGMTGAVGDSIWSLVYSDHLLTVLLALGLAIGPKRRAVPDPACSPNPVAPVEPIQQLQRQ